MPVVNISNRKKALYVFLEVGNSNRAPGILHLLQIVELEKLKNKAPPGTRTQITSTGRTHANHCTKRAGNVLIKKWRVIDTNV